jgi:hypothetical protein
MSFRVPHSPRHFGIDALNHGRPHPNQNLVAPKEAALLADAGTVTDHLVLCAGAARAAKPVGPARAPNRLGALRFGAVEGQELRNQRAGLALDLVVEHQGSASSGEFR